MKHMKKILCISLSLLLITLSMGVISAGAADADNTVTAADGEEPAVYPMGDSNMDGAVSILDATHIQRILGGYCDASFKEEQLSDSNGNAGIDILDATMVQRYIAGLPASDEMGQPVAPRTM